MPTTVQVNEKTLQMLNKVKEEMKEKSHDEVIKTLIIERKKNSLLYVWFKPQIELFLKIRRGRVPRTVRT